LTKVARPKFRWQSQVDFPAVPSPRDQGWTMIRYLVPVQDRATL